MPKLALVILLATMIAGCNNPFASPESNYKAALALYPEEYTKVEPEAMERAKALFLKAAEKNYGDAEYMLGRMHYRGDGFPKSNEKALELFRLASAHGSGEGSFWVAYMYTHGLGVQADESQTLAYAQKGVAQGSVSAKGLLGHLFYHGQVVPQNYRKAHELLLEPAANGDEHSLLLLANIYAKDTSGLKDVNKLIETITAASKVNRKLIYILAETYRGGLFSEQFPELTDPRKAIEIYTQNLDDPSGMAEFGLGSVYASASGVPQDMKKARDYLEAATNKGMQDAGSMLCRTAGDLLKNKQRLDDVEKWCLVPAQQQNDAYAQYVLSCIAIMKEHYKDAFIWSAVAGLNDYPDALSIFTMARPFVPNSDLESALTTAKTNQARYEKAAAMNRNENVLTSTYH